MQVYHHQENKMKPAPHSLPIASTLHFPQSQRTRWIYFCGMFPNRFSFCSGSRAKEEKCKKSWCNLDGYMLLTPSNPQNIHECWSTVCCSLHCTWENKYKTEWIYIQYRHRKTPPTVFFKLSNKATCVQKEILSLNTVLTFKKQPTVDGQSLNSSSHFLRLCVIVRKAKKVIIRLLFPAIWCHLF